MPSVAFLFIVMLIVIWLYVIMLSIILLNANMLSVILLNAIMLSVMAPLYMAMVSRHSTLTFAICNSE